MMLMLLMLMLMLMLILKEEVKVISRNFYCCPIFSSSESDLKM